MLYGREYIFHSDFREWMRYEQLLTDGDVPENLKGELAAGLIFPADQHIPLTRTTGEFMAWFYRCGEPSGKSEDDEPDIFMESRLPYRFDVDFPYIYAAFMERYNIDLTAVDYLHWWSFKRLFRSLHDCKFSEIVGYRMADTSEMSETMKKHYREMQEIYELPVSVAEQRRIEQAQRFLGG